MSLILDSGEVDATDLFCGAGGTTRGAKRAGLHVRIAVNHWDLAIHNHNKYHPETDHDITDISSTEPRRYPRTTVLLASPECKTWSQAAPGERAPTLFDGTNDAMVDRSRVTMWDVLRFAAVHRYELVLVENVCDVGAAKHTKNMNLWLGEWEALGYEWQVVSLNAMVCHPVPQSRDRWFFCAWRKGNRRPDLDIRPLCWCDECGDVEGLQTWKRSPDIPNCPGLPRWGKYRQQYTYRCAKGHQAFPYAWPAMSALDLGLPCPRIGDREMRPFLDKETGKRLWLPLAPATLARIGHGVRLHGPSIVQRSGNTFERPKPGTRDKRYYRTWSAWSPLVTQTGTLDHGYAVPTAMVSGPHGTAAPSGFLVKNNGGVEEAQYRSYPADEPLGAVVGSAVNQSFITVDLAHSGSDPRYNANRVRREDEPLPSQTASATVGMVVPVGGSREGQRARDVGEPRRAQTGRLEDALVVIPNRTHGGAHSPGEPLGTITSQHGGGHFVVTMRNRSTPTGPGEPITAVTGSPAAHGVVNVPLVGELRNHGKTAPATEPLATVAAQGNHQFVVDPNPGLMVRMNGDLADSPSMAIPMTAPTGTLTGAAHQGVVPFVFPYNRTGDPVPVTGPMGTVTTVDRHGYVEPEIDVMDCGFRMLTEYEAGAGQGFPWDEPLEGTKREIVRMYGNAVPPPMAHLLVARLLASLAA